MLVALECHVAMYLVADDKDIVLHADVAHALQLLFCPHTATWVVGVTEQEYLAALDFLLEIGKINLQLSIDKFQWVEHECTLKVVCHVVIRVIHRGLNHNLVAGLGKALQSERDCRHNATDKTDFIGLDLPAVTARHPTLDGGTPTLANVTVTKEFVTKAVTYCIDNKVGGLEIHIGNPHWQHLLGAEHLFQVVILQAIGMLALNDFVKIVLHFIFVLYLFYCFPCRMLCRRRR